MRRGPFGTFNTIKLLNTSPKFRSFLALKATTFPVLILDFVSWYSYKEGVSQRLK